MINRQSLKYISSNPGNRGVIQLIRRCYSTKDKSPLKRLLAESASYNDQHIVDPELQWATLPYSNLPKEGEPPRIKTDPRNTSVILFPGQGTQYIGMGKSLLKYPMAQDVYNHASEVLGMNMLKLCTEGPADELNKHCQLAVMVTSLATLERLREERPSAVETCAATAGFSLGEITALVFAGAIQFEQALKVVQIRATAMEAASRDHPSGMITVLYGADSKVNFAILKAKQHCEKQNLQNIHCQVANYLYPHCKVIAGSQPALEYIEKNYKEFNIRRVQRIKVSGGFHTEVMRPAVQPLREALELCDLHFPNVTVISNVDGKPYRNEKHIKLQLPKQMVRPVRWEQCMHSLFSRSPEQHYPHVYTVGPGSSLRAILRQVNARAWDCCIQTDS